MCNVYKYKSYSSPGVDAYILAEITCEPPRQGQYTPRMYPSRARSGIEIELQIEWTSSTGTKSSDSTGLRLSLCDDWRPEGRVFAGACLASPGPGVGTTGSLMSGMRAHEQSASQAVSLLASGVQHVWRYSF